MNLKASGTDVRDDAAAGLVEVGVEGKRVGGRLFYVETYRDSLFADDQPSGVDWIDGFVYYRADLEALGEVRFGGFYTSFHSSHATAFLDIDERDPGREVKVYGLLATGAWEGQLARTETGSIGCFLDAGGGFGRAELSYKDIDSGDTDAWRIGGRAGVSTHGERWSFEAGWRLEVLHTRTVNSFSSGRYLFHGPFLGAVFRW